MSIKKYERVLLIVVAVTTFVLMVVSLRFERNINNQKLLFYQLQAIRTSVNLFKAITRSNPADLVELATSEYRFPGEEQKMRYLSTISANNDGFIVDPFDNPYVYDRETGWVKSSTRGYELW